LNRIVCILYIWREQLSIAVPSFLHDPHVHRLFSFVVFDAVYPSTTPPFLCVNIHLHSGVIPRSIILAAHSSLHSDPIYTYIFHPLSSILVDEHFPYIRCRLILFDSPYILVLFFFTSVLIVLLSVDPLLYSERFHLSRSTPRLLCAISSYSTCC